jgi:FkbM family methyltransferase
MKNKIKKIAFYTVDKFVQVMMMSRIGRFIINGLGKSMFNQFFPINHNGVTMSLVTPNVSSYIRAATFSIKEPETLEWIDSFSANAVLWDIGANVGLYSIYAAKAKKCKVYSFEPSIFNLELLARNIFKNCMEGEITIIPLPLTNFVQESTFNMSGTDWGGAMSTFGKDFGHDGKRMNEVFRFSTIGLSIEDAIKYLNIPIPDYIKMDVDGIEHFILEGGKKSLREVKEILVEVNDDFYDQSDSVKGLLEDLGFILKEKTHAAMFENNSTYNQIWINGSKCKGTTHV